MIIDDNETPNLGCMDKIDLFNSTTFALSVTPKHRDSRGTRNTLNPWLDSETNPYLNLQKNQPFRNKNLLQQKHQPSSVQFHKQRPRNTFSLKLFSKQVSPNHDTLRVSKQLPKLNIGQTAKKENPLKKQLLKEKALYETSLGRSNVKQMTAEDEQSKSKELPNEPNSNKSLELGLRSLSKASSQILPSVSRQIIVTRKLYLLQNRLYGSPRNTEGFSSINKSQSPIKMKKHSVKIKHSPQHLKVRGTPQLRDMVEKEFSKHSK